MGNVIYGERLSCYETVEACSQACARFECIYVDKCNGGSSAHYVCLPFDTRLFMWLLVGLFLVVVLGCSAIVVCYLIRAIRMSFRHALVTENDIVFCNAANVHTFTHPALYGNENYNYNNNAQYYSPHPNPRTPTIDSTSSFGAYNGNRGNSITVIPYSEAIQQKRKDSNKTFH